MALQKQVITLDFGYGGLDQKSDEKRLLPVRFTELKDVRFNKIGRVDMRKGMWPLGAGLSSNVGAYPYSFTTVALLDVGGELQGISKVGVINTSNYFGSVSMPPFLSKVAGNGRAAQPGRQAQMMPVAEVISRPSGPTKQIEQSITAGAYCRADGVDYYCVVYTTPSTTNVQVEVFDKSTGVLVKNTEFVGSRPRVIINPSVTARGSDQFVIGFNASTTTTVSFRYFDASPSVTQVTTLAGLPDETTVEQGEWDMVALADSTAANLARIGVIYAKLASGIKLVSVPWPGSGSASTTTIAPSAGNVVRVGMSAYHSPATSFTTFIPMWFQSTGGFRSGVYSTTLVQVTAPYAITSATAVTPDYLAGIATNSYLMYFAQNNLGTRVDENKIDFYTVQAAAVTSTTSMPGCTIQSKPAAIPGTDVAWMWTGYSTTTQNTLFLSGFCVPNLLVDNVTGPTGYAAARAHHTTAWGALTRTAQGLPNLQWSTTDLGFTTVSAVFARSIPYSVTTGYQYTLNELFFTVNEGRGYHSAPNRDEVLVTGGSLMRLAAVDFPRPNGPQVFPVGVALSATTVGGSMALGSYAVSGFFEYIDASGRAHRSEPMVPLTFSLTGTQNALILSVQNYRVADSIASNVRFIPTRTAVNESQVYYRCAGAVSNTILSGTTLTGISITAADATVITQEPMYTTGGIFEDSQPSCPVALATNGRRCLVVAGDDLTFVQESKPITPALGVAFMDGVGRRVSAYGDRIYALASFRDKWFAFKAGAVFVAQGDGADPSGQSDTLSEFELLVSDVGTTEPRSVVTTTEGVVYRSARGFYMIGPDLTPVYIGADVEDYTSSVKDSAFDADRGELHYLLSDGTLLVLSIFTTANGAELRWSVDTVVSANAIAVVSARRYLAYSSVQAPLVNISNPGFALAIENDEAGFDGSLLYSDMSFIGSGQSVSAITVPPMAATTAWVRMANIQGFGRVWKGDVLGAMSTLQESMTITVQIGYDYSSQWTETHTVLSGNCLRNGGGENAQFEIRPARQKCEAIRFRITQSTPVLVDDLFGYGFRINQIQLVVGVKANDNKTPASSRMTKG